MSYSTYDSNDVIDLEHVFDEDRMTHYSSSSTNNNNSNNSNNNGFKSHRISLQSVDDDVIKNLHRSLITPLPPRARGYSNKEEDEEDIWYQRYPNRPESRTESVMLFKNINNGNEPVTVDFLSSDLNEFMDRYTDDDLMSHPPSRMPQKRRDSLNSFLTTSLVEKPSFAKPRSKERSLHSLHQTNKENSDEERRQRRDPLHAKSYTNLSVIQRKESEKDNYHLESPLLSLKASVANLIISSTLSNEQGEEYVESPKALQQNDVIRKRLENRNNPEKLRNRYSYNVDHSNVPENPKYVKNNPDKASRRWSSFIPEHQKDNIKSPQSKRATILQQKKSLVDLNYPNVSEPSRDDWENQVTDPPPPVHKTLQRPVRVTSYQYRTDNNKQLSPPTTTRYRKYSNPSKVIDDYRPTNNVTSIPKRTSKLYELATQREPKQQQPKTFISKVTPIVASRSSGELSNSTESSSNSGDLYYDTPPSPPSDRVAFISARTRELSLREPKYRIRTLSEEERMPPRNNDLRSKKLSLDSQKPSVAENARQVLEMVRQRRQKAMSRTH
ncbi:hypothetical protein K501DRAFT_330564 [Backusella circina FSU 941]|nr:hypothetical protein K501DRAFT_330564 [Backusella circina FSU 941]